MNERSKARLQLTMSALELWQQANDIDPEDAVEELLTDLMHWANDNAEGGFSAILNRATLEYESSRAPKRAELPRECAIEVNGKFAIIRRGESGYAPGDAMLIPPDEYNKRIGVTKAQQSAMVAGSMFGWHLPCADPNRYDEDGNYKTE